MTVINLIFHAFYYMNFNNISAFSIILLLLYKSNQNDDFVYTFRTHLVVDILNFESFVTRVTDMDATVKLNYKSEIQGLARGFYSRPVILVQNFWSQGPRLGDDEAVPSQTEMSDGWDQFWNSGPRKNMILDRRRSYR